VSEVIIGFLMFFEPELILIFGKVDIWHLELGFSLWDILSSFSFLTQSTTTKSSFAMESAQTNAVSSQPVVLASQCGTFCSVSAEKESAVCKRTRRR